VNVVLKDVKVLVDSREMKEELVPQVQLVHQVPPVCLVPSVKRVTKVPSVLPDPRETWVKLVLQVHLVLLAKG